MREIRIFVSSPGDCARQRNLLDEVVVRINQTDGERDGFVLRTFRWEEQVVPRIGPPPQTVVDDQTPRCDVYLGIMSSRFGGDDQRESGTEQEFRQALTQFGAAGQPWILFYFNDTPPVPRTREATAQWDKVLAFRAELEARGIVGTYKRLRGSRNAFFEKVDLHLRSLLRRPEFAAPRQTPTAPPAQSAAIVSSSQEAEDDAIPVLDRRWMTTQLARFKAQFAADMSMWQPLSIEAAGERYLDLTIASGPQGTGGGRDLQPARPEAASQQSGPVLAFEALAEEHCPRWLIFGDGGTGKTLALEHLAMRAAERALDDASAPVPVLARLGGFDTGQHPFARLMEIVAAATGTDTTRAEALCRSSARPLLFLFDGFSAIDAEFQPGCVAALKELLQQDRHGIVLTSRPANVLTSLVGGGSGLNVGYVRDLDDDQIHAYLAAHAPGTSLDRVEGLGRNPFVLSALAAWSAEHADGPRTRAALCSYIVDHAIFERRETKKVPSPTRYHYERVKKPILAALALDMARKGTARVRDDIATLDALGGRLRTIQESFARVGDFGEYELMPRSPSPKGLVDELVHNGVLRRRDGFLEFMNQLVQDYFAAVGALEMKTSEVLAEIPAWSWRFVEEPPDNAPLGRDHPLWHPIVMLASLTADSSALIGGIARTHPLLAAECLASAAAVSTDLRAELEAEWSGMIARADPRYRWMGCQCLGLARGDSGTIVQRLIAAALGDEPYYVNVAASRALARIGADRVGSQVVSAAFDTGRAGDIKRDTRIANLLYRLSAPGVARDLFNVWRRQELPAAARHRAERFLASLKKGVVETELGDILSRASAAGDESTARDAQRCMQRFPGWRARLGFPGFPVEIFADIARDINQRSRREQRAARQAVELLGVSELVEKLRDPDYHVRSAAVARLSNARAPEAVEPLIDAIGLEPSMQAIDAIAVAMVACARDRNTAADVVVRALRREDRAVVCSIPALSPYEQGSLAAGTIPGRLAAALKAAQRPAEGRAQPTDRGWTIQDPPGDRSPSDVPNDVSVEDRDGQTVVLALHARARLIRALRFIGNEPAVRELRSAAESDDPFLRASALQTLSLLPADVPAGEILRSIGHHEPRVRAAAAWAAVRWPSDGTAEALARQLANERDPRVAGNLIDALGKTRSRQAAVALVDVLLSIRPSETDDRELAWSVKADWGERIHRALASLDLPSYIQPLLIRTIDESGPRRAAAVAELGRWIKGERSSGGGVATAERSARDLWLAQLALSDDDRLVRALAGRALRWSRMPDIATTFKDELQSPRPERRAAAARALGWLRDDTVVERLRTMLGDDDPDARLAAAEALGRMADDPSLPAAAQTATALALDPDPERRLSAGRAIDAIPGAFQLLLAPVLQAASAGAFQDVVDLSQARLEARPDDARLLYMRGYALCLLERWPEALDDLQRSCQIDDGNPYAHHFLAGALLQSGRYAEALLHARTAVSGMPDEVVALRRLGEAALFERQYLEAIVALERALEIEPSDMGTLLDLGLSRLGANREREAHQVLERFAGAFRQLSPSESSKIMTLTNDYLDKLLRCQPEMAGRVSTLYIGKR